MNPDPRRPRDATAGSRFGRRARIALACAALASSGALVACADDPGGERPGDRAGGPNGGPRNAVLIVVDTLRADHLGCYGYDRETSPRLDRLASTGVLFERSICQAPWTLSSVCSLFTSLYPQAHGVRHASDNRPLPEAVDTLAELLKGDGYATGAFVANELLLPETGVYQGFEDTVLVPRERPPGEGEPDAGAPVHHADAADRVNRFALPWLESRADEPFFLYLHYMDPHDPYTDPAGHHRRFDPDYTGSFDGSIGKIFDTMARGGRVSMDPRDVRHMIARYDGEIRYVDERIGEVLDRLDALGVADETVVVVTGDHGEQFFEHGSIKHGTTIFQEEVHVPLIVAGAGVTSAPRRVGATVAGVDLYPTLLDVLGVALPDGGLHGGSLRPHGRSLVPFLEGASIDRGDVFTETAHGWLFEDGIAVERAVPIAAVFRDADKLVTVIDDERPAAPETDRPAAPPDRLFDLIEDPGERRDASVARPERADALRAAVRRERRENQARRVVGASFTPEERRAVVERLRALGYTVGETPSKGPEEDSR